MLLQRREAIMAHLQMLSSLQSRRGMQKQQMSLQRANEVPSEAFTTAWASASWQADEASVTR
jgi:hypothetical protein